MLQHRRELGFANEGADEGFIFGEVGQKTFERDHSLEAFDAALDRAMNRRHAPTPMRSSTRYGRKLLVVPVGCPCDSSVPLPANPLRTVAPVQQKIEIIFGGWIAWPNVYNSS